jgi:hypothetical protein
MVTPIVVDELYCNKGTYCLVTLRLSSTSTSEAAERRHSEEPVHILKKRSIMRHQEKQITNERCDIQIYIIVYKKRN